jgi:hypothetical protein
MSKSPAPMMTKPAGGEKHGRGDIDHQSKEGKDIGMDLGKGETVDDEADYLVARDPNRAGVCHWQTAFFKILHRSWIDRVMDGRQL